MHIIYRMTRSVTMLCRFGHLLLGLYLSVFSFSANAIEPESMGQETLGTPEPTWVFVRDGLGPLYLFDLADGQMQGLLSITPFTPAVEVNLDKGEFYAAESYYSRGTRGDRTDVLTVYDMASMAPKAEIEIPKKIAALYFRRYIALMDDDRHIAVFNMTPAQSVTVVDLDAQNFVGEISTPGCALNVPTAGRGFFQLCGDGKIQLIRLNDAGEEASRNRSRSFFDIEEDPVFDKTVRYGSGWLLISYQGRVFNVTIDGDDINISRPWRLQTDDEIAAHWNPGGSQFFDYHQELDLLFVVMNNIEGYSHDHAGSEVWVYQGQRRIARVPLSHPAANIFVTQDAEPKFAVTSEDMAMHVYDVATLKLERSITGIGVAPGYLQGLAR